jgi:hypothetical protein
MSSRTELCKVNAVNRKQEQNSETQSKGKYKLKFITTNEHRERHSQEKRKLEGDRRKRRGNSTGGALSEQKKTTKNKIRQVFHS